MIYTITIRNKKTGQEISRDFNLEKVSMAREGRILEDMRLELEDNTEKF